MKNERNAFKAGLFILISIALIITIIVTIEGFERLLEPVQHRTVTFRLTDNLSGLDKGDEVRVGGVKVGKVARIDYLPGTEAEKPMLIVHFSLPEKFKIREGTQISIESTVTGAANLNIANLGTGAELPEQTALVGQTGGIGGLLAKADETITAFKETSLAATAVVKKVGDQVDPLASKYATVADRGSEMMINLRDMIGDSKVDFRGTIANLNASTTSIKEKLPGLLDEAKGTLTKLQATIDNAAIAMEDIKKTVASTRDLTASARAIVVGNRTKFDGMILSLKSASDNVKHATAELRRSPWRLLYKPNPGELDNLVLFDSAREFSEGANDLHDAIQSLRDAIQTGDIPADAMQKRVETLNRSFDKFNEVEQKLWKSVKD